MKYEIRKRLWDPTYLMKTKFLGGKTKFHACSFPHNRVWVAQVRMNKTSTCWAPRFERKQNHLKQVPFLQSWLLKLQKIIEPVSSAVCEVGSRGWEWHILSFINMGWSIIYSNVRKCSYVKTLTVPEQDYKNIDLEVDTPPIFPGTPCSWFCASISVAGVVM